MSGVLIKNDAVTLQSPISNTAGVHIKYRMHKITVWIYFLISIRFYFLLSISAKKMFLLVRELYGCSEAHLRSSNEISLRGVCIVNINHR